MQQAGCHLIGVYRVPRAGLEAWLGVHKAVVIVYSQVFHQPSVIRKSGFGVGLLSPLRLIIRNGNPPLKFLVV